MVSNGAPGKGALAIIALLTTLSASGLYKLKSWSKQYDGLDNDDIDKLKISSAKRVMLKLARRGRQLFGTSFGRKPTSAKEAAAPVKLVSSKKGKSKKGDGLIDRMKKGGWNPLQWFKRKPA